MVSEAADRMNSKKVFHIEDTWVSPQSPLREAMLRIDATSRGIALVVDADRRLLGTLTDGDVRRAVLANLPMDTAVEIILAKKASTRFAKPITAPMGLERSSYLQILQEYGVLHLPLLDIDQRVAGLVTMDEFAATQPEGGLRAVVMAGGQGSRLYPLTEHTPKPMLQVGDRPLMETIIQQLRQAGITNVNISTHYKQEKIQEHFRDGKDFGVNVSYITEEKPLGTAGAIGLMEKTDETLLIINGDILTGLDFRALHAYHKEHEAELTIAVRKYDVQVPYGVVDCQDHLVAQVTEKPVFNFFVNAGIYLVESAAIDLIPRKGERLEMTELIQLLLQEKRRVVSFPILEEWVDIGRHEDFKQAQALAKQLENPS